MSDFIKDKKPATVVSPEFTSVVNRPNPDGTMGNYHILPPGETSSSPSDNASPVHRSSVSPTGSHTKSIMNASGTSGAVVSNTPEPGLKRVATVTFSEPKPFKQSSSPEMELEQGQVRRVSSEADRTVATAVTAAGCDTPSRKPMVSSPLMASVKSEANLPYATGERNFNGTVVGAGVSAQNQPTPAVTPGSAERQRLLRERIKEKRPQEFDLITSRSVPSSSQSIQSETDPLAIKRDEHPRFFVGDPLHTPSTRSRSNSTSPRSSNLFSQGISLEKDDSKTSKPADPNTQSATGFPLEPVVEGSAGQKIAPNVPKRENTKNTDPRLPQDDGKLHILFGATGSLAVFKIKVMIKKLEEIYGRDRVSIQVVLTQSAEKFFTKRFTKKNRGLVEGGQRISSEASQDACTQQATAQRWPLPSLQQQLPANSSSQGRQQSLMGTQQLAQPVQQEQQQQGPQLQHVQQPLLQQRIHSNSSIPPDTPPLGPSAATQAELPPHIQVWGDRDEWDTWHQRTDPVLHIELRRWADILVVAPLTANTLSKIALGLCDNLLTSVVRAWNPMFPVFLAPSMVSSTYNSPVTKKQLKTIKEDMPWMTVFKPSEKVMSINGDIGLGGMMDGNEIVDKVVMKLGGYPKDKEEEEEEEEEEEDEEEEEGGGREREGKGEGDKRVEGVKDEDDEDEEDDEDDEDEEDEDEEDEEDTSDAVQNVPGRISV